MRPHKGDERLFHTSQSILHPPASNHKAPRYQNGGKRKKAQCGCKSTPLFLFPFLFVYLLMQLVFTGTTRRALRCSNSRRRGFLTTTSICYPSVLRSSNREARLPTTTLRHSNAGQRGLFDHDCLFTTSVSCSSDGGRQRGIPSSFYLNLTEGLLLVAFVLFS
jgi:hypothetical protein